MKATVLAAFLLVQYVYARPLQKKAPVTKESIPSFANEKINQPVGTIPLNYRKRQGIDELFESHDGFDDFDDDIDNNQKQSDEEFDNSDDINLTKNTTQNMKDIKPIFKVDQPQSSRIKLHRSEESLEGENKSSGENVKSFTKNEELSNEHFDEKERQETSSIIKNTAKFDKETQEMMKDTGVDTVEKNNPTIDPFAPENYNEYDEPSIDMTDENFASNEPTSDTSFANDNVDIPDDEGSDKQNTGGKEDAYVDSYGNFDEESTNPSESPDQESSSEGSKEEKGNDGGRTDSNMSDVEDDDKMKVNDTKQSSEEVTESEAEEDHEMNDNSDIEDSDDYISNKNETTSSSDEKNNGLNDGDEVGSTPTSDDANENDESYKTDDETYNNNSSLKNAESQTANNTQTEPLSDNIVGNGPQKIPEASTQPELSTDVANDDQTPTSKTDNQTGALSANIVGNDALGREANKKLPTRVDDGQTPASKAESLSNDVVANDAETAEASSNQNDTAPYKGVGDEDDDEDSSMNDFPTDEEIDKSESASLSTDPPDVASTTLAHSSHTKSDNDDDYEDSDGNDDEVFEDEEDSVDESQTRNEYHPTVDAFLIDQIKNSDADIRSKVYAKQHPRQLIGLGPGMGAASPMMGHGLGHPLSGGGRGIPGIDQYGFVGTNVPGFPPGYPLGTKWKSTDHGFVLDRTGFQHPLAPHQACQCGPYGCSCTPLATGQSGKIKSHTPTPKKTNKDVKGSKRALICRCGPLGCGCFPERQATKRQKVDDQPTPHPIDLAVGWPFGYGTNFGWVPRPILPTICPTGKRSEVKGKSGTKSHKRCVDAYSPNMANTFAAEPYMGWPFGPLYNHIGFGSPFSGCVGSCTLGGQTYINNGPG